MKSELVGGLVTVEEVVQLQATPLTFSTGERVEELLGINLEPQTLFAIIEM